MAIVQYVLEKKSMTVSDNTRSAEGLDDSSEYHGIEGLNAKQKAPGIDLKNPGGAL